jgi:hypothetical protein
VLAGAILSFGIAGCTKPGVTLDAKAETTPHTSAAQIKSVWVSQTTGKQFRVNLDGDVFRAEWLNIPPEWVAHGAFMRTECKRQGSAWVGTTTSFMPWSSPKGAKPKVENWCHLETQFEVDSITPETISGRGESVRQIDVKKCQILETGTGPFHWSPVE